MTEKNSSNLKSEKTGHFYFGKKRTFLIWLDRKGRKIDKRLDLCLIVSTQKLCACVSRRDIGHWKIFEANE